MSYNAHLRRDERHHRQAENRAEHKEAQLHARAVNQALHGNFVKAARLESRSNAAGNRADAHHAQATAAHVARVHHPPHPHVQPVHVHHPPPHHHHPPPHHHHPPGHVTVVHHHPPPPQPGYPHNPGYPYPHH